MDITTHVLLVSLLTITLALPAAARTEKCHINNPNILTCTGTLIPLELSYENRIRDYPAQCGTDVCPYNINEDNSKYLITKYEDPSAQCHISMCLFVECGNGHWQHVGKAGFSCKES